MSDHTFWRRTSPERVVTIQSAADVEAVIRTRLLLFDVCAIVQVPTVPLEQSLRWERVLNRSFQECGCSHGTMCTALALGGSLIWYAFHLSLGGSFFLWMLVALVVAATLGKVAGLAWARFRIARVIGEIRKVQGGQATERNFTNEHEKEILWKRRGGLT